MRQLAPQIVGELEKELRKKEASDTEDADPGLDAFDKAMSEPFKVNGTPKDKIREER